MNDGLNYDNQMRVTRQEKRIAELEAALKKLVEAAGLVVDENHHNFYYHSDLLDRAVSDARKTLQAVQS